jgi:DNA-binding MarR family transcriptional regulator
MIEVLDIWMNVTSVNNDLGSAIDTTDLRGPLVGFGRTVLSVPDNVCQRTRQDTEDAYYALYDILEADYNTTTGQEIIECALEFRKQLELCQIVMMNNNQKTAGAVQENQNQDNIAIDDKELTILAELAEASDKTFSQVEIEAATNIKRGTLKDKLPRLENIGLVHRPLGKRKGYKITDKGRKIANRNQ